jgi:hypothetical protein
MHRIPTEYLGLTTATLGSGVMLASWLNWISAVGLFFAGLGTLLGGIAAVVKLCRDRK